MEIEIHKVEVKKGFREEDKHEQSGSERLIIEELFVASWTPRLIA